MNFPNHSIMRGKNYIQSSVKVYNAHHHFITIHNKTFENTVNIVLIIGLTNINTVCYIYLLFLFYRVSLTYIGYSRSEIWTRPHNHCNGRMSSYSKDTIYDWLIPLICKEFDNVGRQPIHCGDSCVRLSNWDRHSMWFFEKGSTSTGVEQYKVGGMVYFHECLQYGGIAVYLLRYIRSHT